MHGTYVPELYPKSASPRLPKPHVANKSAFPLMGYLAVIFLGLRVRSSHDCCSSTCAATEADRSRMDALCSTAEGRLAAIV